MVKLGTNEVILRTAAFQGRQIMKYEYLKLVLLSIPIVTVPITLGTALIYRVILTRIIRSWECVLTNRSLNVKKGIFFTSEKTVPLGKITDIQMTQGPLMRACGLHQIAVETAGTSGPGSLISLVGIADVESFRSEVIEQRDRNEIEGTPEARSGNGDANAVLIQMRDSLKRTEELLQQLVDRVD